MESPFQSLVKCYVHGIIHQAQGTLNPYEMLQFYECRKAIKRGLQTFEWMLMGFDGHVVTVVMQMGDRFLGDGNVQMAMEFYHEASHMFPHVGICYIRETQCHVVLKCFDQAKKACRKAIRHSDDSDFNQLYSIIDMFIENNRLQEAHDLYIILMDRFPHHYQVLQIVQELKILLRDKAEESKKEIRNKKKKNVSKGPASGIKKTTSKNIGQTSKEKLGEASGGTDPSDTVDIAQNAASAKVVKSSKQLKREQMAREKEIDREIEKARKELEEKRKKQEEVEAPKRKEREEQEEKLRKQEEVEARERKEREEHEKKLEKQRNDEIKKQQGGTNKRAGKKSSKTSNGNRAMDTHATRSKNSSTNTVLPKKLSLNDMSTDFDRTLSSGSQLRRVCSTCNTPRAFSYNQRNCHSCRSEFVVWYKRVTTTGWVRPRMPPNQDIAGRYVQCKHFLQEKRCVKTPCAFAHGEDELEIWELCRVKKARQQAPHSRNEGFKERKTSVSSLPNSWSCRTVNGHDSGTGRRSRTESLSSHRSQSSSNTFDLLSTEDTMLADFHSDSEYSYFSQDGFDELSQDSAGRSTSSLSLNVDMDGLGPKAEAQTTPVEPDQSDDGWTEVRRRKKPQRIVSEEFNRENRGKNKKKKKKASSSATATSSQSFDTTVLLVKEQEKLRCEFCKITFSSMLQLEYHYSDPQHRVNVMKKIQQFNAKSYTKFRPPPDGVYMGRYKLCRRFEQGYCYFGNKCTFAHGHEECTYWKASYQLQAQQLAQFQEKRLLTENFSENVWRRMKHEGEHHVLKENLPGVTVNCSSPLRMKLDGPQDHMWIFDVRIQTKYRELLRQVAFLLETHLDKFKFFRNPRENCSSNMQSIQLLEEDFVENSAKQESAVQFCVQFSSHVFGDFQQKLVFDFGDGSVLARSLYVSVVSKDICSSKEEPLSRTTYCRILEWSVEKMELILCKDLKGLNLNSLCEQYNIPKDLPADHAESVEFTRETYCKVWHDLLFIEEQHIQMEVARYDIQNGAMKIVNSFQSVDKTIFAQRGELFGEIYLSDYLVMDEVAGHLINRSVMSVILRPKVDHSQSNRVYECSIKLKTSQSVIIKLNEVLCKDYVFVIGQEIYIDVKFRYNRLPMCEMHQAIDMCKEKTKVLLPNVKNVSYTDKKSIHDWFMDRKPNTNQHEAIAMILDPSPTPPILVIGPFGTGKTFTLSLACVSILSQPERKKVNKVLICTHSNSAATIHLQHLDEKIAKKPLLNLRPLRVYNLLRNVWTIPEKLRKYCLIEETTNVIKEPSWNEIRDHNVIITTLATARMLWKFYQDGRLRFTHILIDEAAQALEPECVTPLVMADGNTKIVLAGDHKQMGPQVYSKCLRAEDVGPKRSLLERLFTHYKQCDKTSSQPSFTLDYKNTFLHTPYLVLLTENYRCHAKILDFPSDCFYGGKLVAKGDQSTHELVPVLSFYAAQGVDNRDEESLAYYNDAEVAEVVKRVEELVQLWPKDWSESIGVLTPYRDQVRRIRDGLRKRGLGYVDVETVENVQGKEFKALFISTVRTMWTCSQIEGRNIDEDPSELDFAFLSDPRFLNTAVTRAQSLLAVVGDPMSLCSVGACRNLWKEYLQRCDANKGLYGCTLKTVMDFCLRSQALDPSAHEFTPNKNVQDENDETLTTTSSKGAPKVSNDENSIGIEIGSSSKDSETELDNASISHGSSSTAITNQTIQPVSSAVVSGQDPGRVEGIQVDRETDLTEDNQSNRNENVSDKDENKDEDDSEINEAATDDFFHRDGIDDNCDKIIEELIKACQETREKDEACQETKKKDGGRQQNVTVEDFPSLTDVSQAPSTPRWSNVSINRTFSAGFKDGRIELGFHVKDSERFVRLTGGKLSLKENGDNQSGHDIDAVPQEELLKLLKRSPTLFAKCSFRIDTASRQLGYCGQLPTPDSPDIHIPGRVRRVYEDDVVVLELRPSARARDEMEQKQEVKIFGYIKGVLRRLIEPEERQFVCTVDRASPGVMIPINKNSPKLMNFTKTDENRIIPIYIMKDKEVSRATILSKKHYGEALAGERVFVVKYLKWRPDCPYPLGLAIRHIPHGRDFKTGMEILFEEYNVKREFDTKLRKSVERQFSENWQVPASEKGRHVYRDNVFTIDPPESLDLDDAISIRSLGNGNYELHIHIADVSYFVLPNTPLDEEARLRGTSYYPPKPKETVPMPKETVPMLPRELSENCCSLLKGKDRLALTLSVEVKPDGTVVGDARIERSVVRSSSRLTYLQAQKFIDESSQTEVLVNGEVKQIPVEEAIGVVHRMAQERRRSRLGLGRSLYERKRDDSDDDDENEREAHQMIEEIMVMANHLVAKYLLKKFPNCTPLRVQPPPKARRVVEWRQRFQKFVNFSLGLEWLGGDQETAQEEKIKLKVPFTTWSKIINQVRQNSNFEELVKLVCDLDLFPQLALANVHQQLLQQRGQYMCSGETFENIRFPWLQDDKETPTDKQKVHADVSSNSPIEIASLPEDNESISEDTTDQETNSGEIETDATDDLPVSSSASVNEGVQSSADVSNQQELKKILYGHYSLCLDAYCHFTSPIRRYIDIIVHRLVVASIENRPNFMDSDDITILCDRCTFFARNSRRFDKNAKKLRLAVNSQSSMRFVSAFIDEIAPDALKLFFGTGEFELLRGKSVRIARLGPDKDPEGVDDHIKLQWTFRFLRLDRQGRAQPKLYISDDEESQDLAKDEDPTDSSEVSDDDFDYTVSSEHWNGVLKAVKNQNEDKLKSRLQEVDDDLQKQEKPESSTKISLVKKLKNDASLSSNEPYQHPNTGKPEPSEKETDEFLKVVKSFKPYDRVKVQICSEMTRGILSPAIQLFKLTDKLHACIEHRSFPTTCFAKTSYKRPTNTEVSDITEYVKLWKPVLMMEIATSAVRENDVITLSNLRVSFAQDSKGLVTMEFNLSNAYIKDHVLDPLDLNLMCVRVKDPDGSGKNTGYWVGHFQISEELRKKEDARKILEEAEKNAKKDEAVQPDEAGLNSSTPVVEVQDTKKAKKKENKNTSVKKEQDDRPTLTGLNPPVPGFQNAKKINSETKTRPKKEQFRAVLARRIHSSTPVPKALITQRYCYVTVELLMLNISDRRRLGALVDSVIASELVQNICIGEFSTELEVEGELPKNLSLCNVHPTLQDFFPLNSYQRNAVQEALTKSFTLIQGPPGTGKTVTGVHIAYWFAQLNQKRLPTVEKEGEACNGSMVFYCGPSNKSVDVVARYLMKIPGLKILRIYGQEIERKVFPVPDKVTLFRSKRVAVQLKADEDLKDVSLHHVIRSAECPLAKTLKTYDEKFKAYTGHNPNAPRKMVDEFNKVKSEAEEWAITQRGVNVILATCTTAYSHRILAPCEGFVCQCIIDECGMCIEAETLCAMLGSDAKQVVLIGDHKQLQPVIQCDKAKDLGLGISMFERFSERAQMLEIQYRMHQELCQFPSEFFYDGKLKTAPQVLDRRPDNVTWPNGDKYPFVFHHVEGIEESLIVATDQGNENSKKNQKEIEKVVYVARRLINEGITGDDIVILSPYRAQCFEITEKLKQHVGLNNISVMSVVAAQGSEKNYVILSLVRSVPEREIERNPSRSWLMEHLGFLTDEHQINVALTRAKRGLCIVGNANLIGICSMWRALLKHYENKGCLKMTLHK